MKKVFMQLSERLGVEAVQNGAACGFVKLVP